MRRIALVASMLALMAPGIADATIGKAITPRQILQIAIRRASAGGDAHPTGIVYATATLGAATKALEPAGQSFYPGGSAPGEAGSSVDVVVMHGHFVSNLVRSGHRPPSHPLMALVIDSQTGFVEFTVLEQKLPVPLSNLGPVTPLHDT